nr:hypothetical protein CFP56_65600 [Quercus suber]
MVDSRATTASSPPSSFQLGGAPICAAELLPRRAPIHKNLKSLLLAEKLVAYHKRQMYTMKTTLVPTQGSSHT